MFLALVWSIQRWPIPSPLPPLTVTWPSITHSHIKFISAEDGQPSNYIYDGQSTSSGKICSTGTDGRPRQFLMCDCHVVSDFSTFALANGHLLCGQRIMKQGVFTVYPEQWEYPKHTQIPHEMICPSKLYEACAVANIRRSVNFTKNTRHAVISATPLCLSNMFLGPRQFEETSKFEETSNRQKSCFVLWFLHTVRNLSLSGFTLISMLFLRSTKLTWNPFPQRRKSFWAKVKVFYV